MAELRARIGSPARTYKANHLLREKHRGALEWFLGPDGPISGRARVVLVDKERFLIGTFLGLLANPDVPGWLAAPTPGWLPGPIRDWLAGLPDSTPDWFPSSTAGSLPGSTPGSLAGSTPGSTAGPTPGSLAGPTPGSLAGPTPDSLAGPSLRWLAGANATWLSASDSSRLANSAPTGHTGGTATNGAPNMRQRSTADTTHRPTNSTCLATDPTRDATDATTDPANPTTIATKTTRSPAETTRDTTETTHRPTKTTRSPNQTTRDTNETTHRPTKTTRDANETTHDAATNSTVLGETTRDPTETTRGPTETTHRAGDSTVPDASSTALDAVNELLRGRLDPNDFRRQAPAWLAGHDEAVRTIAARQSRRNPDRIVLDPLFWAITRLADVWGEPVAVVHDRHLSLTPSRVAGLVAAGGLARFDIVSASLDARVQLADFLAGIVRRTYTSALDGAGDSSLLDLVTPYLAISL